MRARVEDDAERAAAVDVAGELGDRVGGLVDRDELDDAGALRAAGGLLDQDLGRDDLARGLEELDKILVRGRPGELRGEEGSGQMPRQTCFTSSGREAGSSLTF